jgi:hypothetical protein
MKVSANDLGMCGVEQLFYAGTVKFNDTGIDEGKAIYTIPHDAVITRVVAKVTDAFDAGTTNVVTVGTSAENANELLGAGDITEGTEGVYTKQHFTEVAEKSKLYAKYTQTGTDATAGEAEIYVFAVGIPEVIS